MDSEEFFKQIKIRMGDAMDPEELKELRKRGGLSIGKMAALIGVSDRTFRRYEAGTKDIPLTVVYLINMLFKVR